jgi:tRNA(Ile)-lysidine synthase
LQTGYLILVDTLNVVKNVIRRHELIARSESVLIALSGGPDSVALLHLLTRLRKSMNLSLTAVYINHLIRKRAAKKEEEFCQALCDRHALDLDIVTEDIPALAKRRKKGVEETARDFRYDVFELLAEEDGHDRIALGHHMDDRIETVLFRILRGTGTSGLVGIPIKRDKIIRPLYRLSRQDILAYLQKHKLDYCVDSSNEDAYFSRNFIRNRLLVQIRKRLNPQVDRAILNLSEIAAEEEGFLERLTDTAVRKSARMTPAGKIELDLNGLAAYDTAIRRRLLRRCVKTLSPRRLAPDKEVTDRLDQLVTTGGKTLPLPGRLRAIKIDDKLVIHRRDRCVFDQPLEPGRLCRLDLPSMDFRSRVIRQRSGSPARERKSRIVTLDWQKLHLPLHVRNIRAGDRFRPLGLGGTKKIGDYLTDRKVPAVYRDEIPVVCDAKGVVWLVGYEIDDRVKVDRNTGKVVSIEVSIRK